ncbi:site-specific recombinase resolvase [Methylococcus mesophilus]|uniref:site-specific recombinase resolvase n=1 Tax=Methylococcus mesophilus TaxID=2993564 RepID=UPI00224B585C|nr:site-specific recombinase resolvase [Methylococcus mesophilus]UZR28044.1 site-specific recombinase resolvase [Methylococcus mesophilus]UZR28129.1 site-specific recombinase resolvase [Methylococcus mesophilus]
MKTDAWESFVPLTFRRRGVQRLVATAAPAHDLPFLVGLGRALYWQHLLDTGVVHSGSDIARQEDLHPSTVNELLRLTLLAPDLIERLMAGRQPRPLTLMWFQRHPLPVDWAEQRDLMVSFE